MLILRKPWDSQPQGAVGIDWNSPQSRGLLLSWPLNGSVYDAVDSANPKLPTNNGTTVKPFPRGLGAQFNGSSDIRIAPTGGIVDSLNITMCGWAYFDSFANAYNTFLSRAGSGFFDLHIKSNGKLAIYAKDTGGTTRSYDGSGATTLSANTLYFIAATVSTATGITGYVNAVVDGTAAMGGTGLLALAGSSFFTVGNNPPSFPTRYINGGVFDVRVYDRVLSQQELREIYDNPYQLFAPRSIYIPTSAGGAGAFTLTASAGSFTLAGQSATLLKSKALGAAAGSFALAGQSANLLKGRTLTADAGAFSLAGQSATLLKSKVVAANAGAFVLAGQAATLKADRKLTAAAGSFALSGQAATLTYSPLVGYTLTASAGAFTLAGQSATLLRSKVLPAAVGAFSFSGQAATLTHTAAGSYSLTANVGSFTITGSAAQLLRGYRLAATAGAFSLAGSAAGLLTGRRLVAAAAAYAFTGSDATLTHSAAAASYTLSASVGAFAFSGVAVTFRFNRQLTGQAGAFVLSGGSATLTNSGAIFTTSEHWRYTFPVNDMRYAMPVDDMRHTFPSGGLTYNFGE